MNTTGRMTHHRAVVPAGRPRIADLVRATARHLCGRVHVAADDRARALGWEVTETPGWLGLSGRRYHDPRFAPSRQAPQDAQTRREGRHD